jgi:hypothetical protein
MGGGRKVIVCFKLSQRKKKFIVQRPDATRREVGEAR